MTLEFKREKNGAIITFPQPEEGKWYNLESGRLLTNTTKKQGRIYVMSEKSKYPRVAGTEEQLDAFFRLNEIKRDRKVEINSDTELNNNVIASSSSNKDPIDDRRSLSSEGSHKSHSSRGDINIMFKYNLKGKDVLFAQPNEGNWFNLETGNLLTNQNKKPDRIYIISDHPKYPRIAGTLEQIDKFFAMNGRIRRDIRCEGRLPEGPDVSMGFLERFMLKHTKTRKVTDFMHMTNPLVREGVITKYTKPSKLTVKQTDNIDLFSLEGYQGEFRISRVYDGDTFEVVFFVPFSFFTGTTNKGLRKALASTKKGGIHMKNKCRLYGFDAQEHDRWEGLCAAIILYNALRKQNGVAYGKIGKSYETASGKTTNVASYDKYGRLLVDFYLDKNYSKSFISLMSDYNGHLEEIDIFIDGAYRLLLKEKELFKNALGIYRKMRVENFRLQSETFKSKNPNLVIPEYLEFESNVLNGKYILGLSYMGDTKNKAMDLTEVMSTENNSIFYKAFDFAPIVN